MRKDDSTCNQETTGTKDRRNVRKKRIRLHERKMNYRRNLNANDYFRESSRGKKRSKYVYLYFVDYGKALVWANLDS